MIYGISLLVLVIVLTVFVIFKQIEAKREARKELLDEMFLANDISPTVYKKYKNK